MPKFLAIVLCMLSLCLSAQKSKPVSVIFDTDIAPDYDDVGAMALLHALADAGEAKILATISCNAFETTAPTISVLNTYFGRPDIPVGITKREKPNMNCSQKWAEFIIDKYPHNLKENAEATEAVKLYRRILAKQPDQSVTIITVGFFTNLADLLDSRPDEFSKLSGKDLIRKKVKWLVSMAAGLDKNQRFREFNVHIDARASQKVFTEWNTPMLLSGFEIGEKIRTGIRLINNEDIQSSPVKDAYQVALAKDKNTQGRNSWDQTAVLVAIKGIEPYFSYRKLNLEIKEDGTNVLIPGEKLMYLTEKMPPAEVATIIEDYMMHQPKKK
ncbi:nucleoside hydrolase [Emticicia sp. 21SJ11W-3]|uniref:nucleoside hydrolase n=1 Tax=Emticicia sp. 21SJ11W-3 TaxID=2916755 RepID=UPI00209DF50E|nr:nucleoside hydrolase [Emticicia sp. 21SJ11W-3]UTA67250.1 nucleoside hydrolase [Emticicia sp. 21SJ11W-3]